MAAARGPDGSVSRFLSNRLERVRAVDDSIPAQAEIKNYCDFVDDAIDRRGFADSLFRHTPSLLRATNAEVIRLFDEKKRQTRCALHIVRDNDDEVFWINGLVKADGELGSVVQELLARSISDTIRTWGDNITFRACYRVFPIGYVGSDGRMRKQNKGSARLFREFRFKEINKERILIEGNIQDKHLTPSAEADGKTFIVKIVESTEHTAFICDALIEMISLGAGRS